MLEPRVVIHSVFCCCWRSDIYGLGLFSREATRLVRQGDGKGEGGIEVAGFHAKFLLGTVHGGFRRGYSRNSGIRKGGDEFFRHLEFVLVGYRERKVVGYRQTVWC